MTDLMLPDGMAPSNLHLKPSVRVRWIDGDVLDICQRLAEISPRLHLWQLEETEQGKQKAAWIVTESCPDGVERRVNKYQELDQRMLVDVQRMLHIPLEHRVQAAQDEIDRENAKLDEDNLEALWDRFGHQLWRQLERCHFIDTRPVSYPKLGVAAPGRAR